MWTGRPTLGHHVLTGGRVAVDVESIVLFPDLDDKRWHDSHPGPYERQMGGTIARLMQAFAGHVPDVASNEAVQLLSARPAAWAAAHATFDEVRRRYLATNEPNSLAQYAFEESCAKALYNATDTSAPFDSSVPFFVYPMAFALAKQLGWTDSEISALFAEAASRT